MIEAGLGRFGPYIKHNSTYANVESIEDVFTIGINRAVAVLAEKAAGGGKGRFQRAKPTVLKDLGEHPDGGGKIEVLSGKYGPYVSHNKVYATLPKGKEAAVLTVGEAVALLAERAAKGGKTGGKSKAAKPKAGAKSAAKAPGKAAASTPAKKATKAKSSEKARSEKKPVEA